jgi:rod shape-determining protein MreC
LTRRRKKIVALLVLVMIFVLLSLTPPISRIIKTNVGNIFSPVTRVISAIGRKIGQIWDVTFHSDNVVAEKTRLQEELDTLKAEKAILDEELRKLKAFHEQLERLNQMTDITFRIMAADIIGWEPNTWHSAVLINRGSGDGVTIGSLVVEGDCLVGRIVEVKSRWSRVRLLTDRRSVAPALIKGKGIKGIVVTTSDNRLLMDYMDDVKDLEPGDTVITSMTNHQYEKDNIVFPQGLMIGTIAAVNRDKSVWYSAVIEPAVDFSRLERVAVIVME